MLSNDLHLLAEVLAYTYDKDNEIFEKIFKDVSIALNKWPLEYRRKNANC